jgi:hypothetical protein
MSGFDGGRGWNSLVLEPISDTDGHRIELKLAVDGVAPDGQLALHTTSMPKAGLNRQAIFGDRAWRIVLALQQEMYRLIDPGSAMPIYLDGTAQYLRAPSRDPEPAAAAKITANASAARSTA